MKKLFILFTFVFIAFQTTAQVRNINLEVKLLAPQPNDILYIANQFDITTQIKNLGPDTITTNDTAAWSLSFNGGQISFGNPPIDHINYAAPNLLPGDSAQIRIQFTLGQGWTTGNTIICSKMVLRNATDSIMDGDTTNNISCASTDVRDPLSVNNLSQKDGYLKVYPNPAKELVYFDITLQTTTDVDIVITDLAGRNVKTHHQRGLTKGQHQMKISLEELPAGNYLYTLQADSKVTYGKLLIE